MAKKTMKKSPGAQTPDPSPVSSTGDNKMEAAATGSIVETKTTTKTANKPELVATQTRSKLVPINLDDEIRQLAYLLSERRGFQPGHETEDWLKAEREVRQRYQQTSA